MLKRILYYAFNNYVIVKSEEREFTEEEKKQHSGVSGISKTLGYGFIPKWGVLDFADDSCKAKFFSLPRAVATVIRANKDNKQPNIRYSLMTVDDLGFINAVTGSTKA